MFHITKFPAALGVLLGTLALSSRPSEPLSSILVPQGSLGVSLSLAHLVARTIRLLLFTRALDKLTL